MRVVTVVILLFVFACGPRQSGSETSTPKIPGAYDTLSGAQLAAIHCQKCHMLPDPSELDSLSWARYVLPRMAHALGIMSEDQQQRLTKTKPELEKVLKTYGYFPEPPALSDAEWKKLKNYYLSHAPVSIKVKNQIDTVNITNTFKPTVPSFRLSPPGTSMIRIEDNRLFLGDVHQQMLYQFDKNLRLQNAAKVKEGVVDIEMSETGLLLTIMGSFAPTDEPAGFLLDLPVSGKKAPQKVIQQLRRPVDTQIADLNQDGRPDLIISEFGQWYGQLAWWENLGASGFQPHVLRKPVGAIRSFVREINADSLPDIIALFGQGDEGIFAYMNLGNGQFEEKTLIRFPPSYGSSNLRLKDFNQDGYEDIIYTAGDNADFPPILKPYHGVHIYLNQGDYTFIQEYFFPLAGAYDAIAEDFDLDGDMDLAAIAFFPDYEKEEPAGFVFYEQQANGSFTSQTFEDQNLGRWMVMDAGDLDEDGDIDIALGSMAFETVPPSPLLGQWVQEGIPFVLLENKSADKLAIKSSQKK